MNDTLRLDRMEYTNLSTIGELYVDDIFECYILEPTSRGKVDHPSIPSGTYEITMSDEPVTEKELKFGFPLPHINGVPGRTAIEMHPGSYPVDTEGCLLTGNTKATDFIGESRVAFAKVAAKIRVRLTQGKVYIAIIGGSHVA